MEKSSRNNGPVFNMYLNFKTIQYLEFIQLTFVLHFPLTLCQGDREVYLSFSEKRKTISF